ncbi:MAG: hypothetical protein WCT28_01610 [Patescibacteria group bacterium]|jgi:hypothetical protein
MKRKTFGLILLITPIPLIFATLSLYGISSFVISSMISASAEASAPFTITGGIIQTLLGLLGIIGVIGVLIGMPIGIYLLTSSDKK